MSDLENIFLLNLSFCFHFQCFLKRLKNLNVLQVNLIFINVDDSFFFRLLVRASALIVLDVHEPLFHRRVRRVARHDGRIRNNVQLKEIKMIPLLGNNTIEFGKPEKINAKLGKLLIFYKQILPQHNWSEFSTISVKYEGQIVCN